jgi:phospholipase/carboxylesterase
LNLLPHVELATGAEPAGTIIWLHGLGADAHDFEPIVPELNLPARLQVRFVFPNAPVQPVTINGGMRMPAWYDILQLGGGPEDEAGIRSSQSLLDNLVFEQGKRNIPASRIVLAGFSQGGAIALQAALRHPERLAGVLALSTYLPLRQTLEAEKSPANLAVPIFMAHGTHDPVIPFARAEESRQLLERSGYAVQWRSYPMPHSVCPQEIEDIGAFLAGVL